MRVRGAAVVACAALLVAACSGNGDAGGDSVDETAVLGVVAERTTSPTPEPTMTTPPAATARPAPKATVTPAPTRTAERTARPERTTEPPHTPVPTSLPAPARPSRPAPGPVPPSPADPDPGPPGPEPAALTSGPAWSTNTLLPDADGEGWTEVGGPPPVGEDGTAAERLLTRLVHEGATGDAAGRHARCSTWIEALPGAPLRVDGEAVVELLVGEDVAARSVHRLEVTVGTGQRLDLPRWERAVRLHAAEGQSVTCTAWFAEAG